MLPESQFYQIGGFRAHSHAWRQFKYDREGDEGLAWAIAGDNSPLRPGDSKGVELILGIKPSGASYLLMNAEQMRVFTRALRLPTPYDFWSSKDFESLSPIYFRTVDELLKKIKTYSQKSNKNKGGKLSDNSQANKTYLGRNPDDSSGVFRGAFEHSRLLYRVLRDEVDCFKFGLAYPPWTDSIRFFSLTLNTWSMDQRNRRERLMDPKVLDIAWTEITRLAASGKRDPGTSVHIRVKENLMLSNLGSKRLEFEHTEIMNLASLASRLQEFFAKLQESKRAPIILLIHDQEVTYSVLQCASVDTSKCQLGIRNLFGYQMPENDVRPSRQARSRSRSPRRDSRHDAEHQLPIQGNRSRDYVDQNHKDKVCDTGRARQYAPIYVVDVQSMYRRLMQTDGRENNPGKDVASMAPMLLPGSPAEWCAGNECHILFDIWQSLAEGPPIDEQRTSRQAAVEATQIQPLASTSQVVPPPEDSERDPNDIIHLSRPSDDPYEDLDDDDDDEY